MSENRLTASRRRLRLAKQSRLRLAVKRYTVENNLHNPKRKSVSEEAQERMHA
jgi:hypothetical protein